MKNTQVNRLKKLFELSLTLSGDPMEIFQHAAKMIGELLEVKIVCLSEIQGERLKFLAVYLDGEIYSNAGSCLLAITPCATVEQSKDIRVYARVKELFPEATFLQDHNADAYCGFPSLDKDGHIYPKWLTITKSFVDGINDNSNDAFIVETVITLGQKLGMSVVAEGVENIEQWKILKSLGCDTFQGYYFCKPMPVQELVFN